NDETLIVGVVFLDANGNGYFEEGESVRMGHDVYLEDLTLINQGKGGSFYTTTDENGQFYFRVQSIGDYEISTDLLDMQLTTPFFAEEFMPPHKISVTKQGETVQILFGLSGDTTGDLFMKNRDNSVIIYNEQYGIRTTPKAEGHDAKSLTPMETQQLDIESFTGANNAAEIFLAPNGSTLLGGGEDNTRRTRADNDNFTVIVGQNVSPTGSENVFNVNKNSDGSLSLVNKQYPTVTTTLGENGSYTITDSEFPDHVVSVDDNGNFVVSDNEFPDASLSVSPDGTQIVQDKEFEGVSLLLNGDDSSYTITDEEFPDLVAVYNPDDDSYVVTDTVENLTVYIDSQGNYTVVDNESGTCLEITNLRGGFFKKIGAFFNKIAKFVAKIASFVKKIASFIKKALPIITKVLRVVSTVTAILAPIFPPLCPVLCAISAFTGNLATFLETNSPAINAFLDKTIDIAGKIEEGANKVAAWTEPKEEDKNTKRAIRRVPRNSLDTLNCKPPPTLALDYLVGAAHDSYHILTWATLAEFGNQGFNIWRTTKLDPSGNLINLTQLNAEMIAAQSDAQWGTTYSFKDEQISANQTYYYVLENIDADGMKTKYTDFVETVQSVSVSQPVCLLYGVQDEALNDSQFFVHDLVENVTRKLGEIHQGYDIEAMAIHPITQQIFVASGDNAQGSPKGYLYQFNPETGDLVAIGATGFKGVTSLTFDATGDVLWAWAEHDGLGQINPTTGEGTLISPFSFKVGDLLWNASNSALYATFGSQLWQYIPATGESKVLCSNLPHKTEALTKLPLSISSEGYLLLGSHHTGFQLHAFDAANCESVVTRDVEMPFDDVEGLAISDKACVNY
ncbi:MAG: hypothetical protein VSS52_009375, partial [Thiotrichaceae bacterium]|nr:hypothetical protein [Thiotrichaceae bacterium]